MQKYDAAGNALWDENGRVISDNPSDTWISDYIFAKDADENLLLIFQDMRNGNKNIYAYKISQEGELLWGEAGIQITDNRGFSSPFPSIVAMPAAVAFAWIQEPPMGATQLVMQKLNADGQPLWGEQGLVPPGQEDAPFTQASITTGGDDALILVYGVQSANAPQVMSIYAQKFDAEGNPVWLDGQAILLHDAVPLPAPPNVISDGAGGVYVAWHSTDLKAFVQHLDEEGILLMTDGGHAVTVSSDELEIAPQTVASTAGDELIVFWTAANGGQSMHGLRGQSMSPSGELLWDDNGRTYVELSPAPLGMVTPALSSAGYIVFYGQGETDPANQATTILALQVNNFGNLIMQTPLEIATTSSAKQDLQVGGGNNQAWVTVWADRATDEGASSQEIYMQVLLIAAVR